MNLKLTTLMASLLVIAGCQSAPYKTQYTFTSGAEATVQQSAKPKSYSIIVSEVKSFGTGTTTDMTYSRDANVIEAYTKSAWAEPPTQLVKVALANALIASNGYQDVLMAPTSIQSPYKIDVTIQKMQQHFAHNESFVELTLMVRLVNTATQKLVFSNIYSAKEAAKTLNAEGGVDAYNIALQRMMPKIVRDINNH